MKKKKLIAVLVVLTLLITGCSRNKENSASSQNIKGRYMENNISLPEGFSKNACLKLTQKNGLPFLYAFTGEEHFTIIGYQMNRDGTWSEDTPKWLESVSLPAKPSIQDKVFEDSNGNQYLYYVELLNDSFKGNLLRSTDGITYETLHPEGWEDKDPEYDFYTAPENVDILEDGTLVTLTYGKVNFYDMETLKIQNSITDTQYTSTILTISDQSLILGQQDNNGKIIGIDVYNTAKSDKKTSSSFQTTLAGSSYLYVNEKKDLIICNSDGIHVLEPGTSLWQTVVDGTLTSLTMQTLWSIGFVADSDDNYYVLYNSNDGYSLMKYAYDETIDSVPSTELTIYSLKNNSTLRQAAAIFQQKHPEVKVSFTIAMTDEEYATADSTIKEDYIRALNTELLAGGGSDILILDGLPADSFVEKGVLTDINDIIKPMIDSGELYSNIINHYINDDKIYYIPARFTLKLLCGRSTDVDSLSTLDALADYAVEHNDTSLLGSMTLDDFITTFSPYLTEKIMDSDGKINKENLVSVLNDLKTIADNCGIVDEYFYLIGKGNTIWDLASRIQISINPCAGFLDTMFPLGIVSYVNGSYTPFENSFIPNCEIGINRASSHKELCKEFISLVLSEEIEKNDFYDGFPINKQALTLCSRIDRSDYFVSSDIENEDGSFSKITLGGLKKEQIDNLVIACSMVSNKAVCDEQIITAFKEKTKEFFQGSLSVDETADRIIEKTSVYLSE